MSDFFGFWSTVSRQKNRKYASWMVNGAVCLAKKAYGRDTGQNQTDWVHDRFQQWSQKGTAIVSGSTFADSKEHGGQNQNSDAAYSVVYRDQDAVRSKRAIMTVSSLGPQDKALSDNEHIIQAFDMALTEAAVASDAVNLLSAFNKAEKTAYQENQRQEKKPLTARNSSAAALIEIEGKQPLSCQLLSRGNTMALVLDSKDFTIKAQLPARQYGDDTYHLIGEQSDALRFKKVAVAPDDVIILINRGVWSALDYDELDYKHEGEEVFHYTDIFLQKEAFDFLREIKATNEHAMAKEIVNHMRDHLISSRAEKLESLKDFYKWREENLEKIEQDFYLLVQQGQINLEEKSITLNQLIALEKDQGKAIFLHFKEKLLPYLKPLNANFSSLFGQIKNEENLMNFNFIGLIDLLKKANLTDGGDATLVLMRVPDPDVELFRPMFENSGNLGKILLRLERRIQEENLNNFDCEGWFECIIQKLFEEREIESGSRGEPVCTAKYKPEQRSQMISFVKSFFVESQDFFRLKEAFYQQSWYEGWYSGSQESYDILKKKRESVYQSFMKEVDALDNTIEKMNLLNAAKKLPLFKEHRNRSIFWGAFGRTQTIKKIDAEIEKIEKSQKRVA